MANPNSKSVFTLQFLKGVRNNTSDRLQLDGELASLENGEINRLGEIEKRRGYSNLPKTTDSSAISGGRGLATFDDELGLFDGYRMFSYAPGLDHWINRGKAKSIILDQETIMRNDGYQQTAPDAASLNGFEAFVYADERGGLRYSVIDQESRTRIIFDALLDSSGLFGKVLAFSKYFIFAYSDNSNRLRYKSIDTTQSALTLSAAATVDTMRASFPSFDMTVATNAGTSRLFFAYHITSTGVTTTRYLDSSLSLSSTLAQSATGHSGPEAICIVADPSGTNLFIGDVVASGASVWVHVVSFNNTLVNIGNWLELGGALPVFLRIAGYASSSTLATFFYEVADFGATDEQHYIKTNTMTSSAVAGTASVFKRSLGIAAKPFSYQGVYYLPCAHESEQQPSIFLLDQDGDTAAKIAYQQCGGLNNSTLLPETNLISSGLFMFAHSSVGKDLTEDQVLFSRLGVARTELDFTSQNGFVNIPANNQLLIIGGIVQAYDRNQLTELNFHLYPEGMTGVSSFAGDGYLSANGLYQYTALFAWTDALGNECVSRPMPPLDVLMGVHSSPDDTVTLTVPTLRLTNKTGVRIEIYRTKDAGEEFRMITSSISPLYNSTTQDSLTFVDKIADTDLDDLKLLYTSGEAADLAPPAASLITTFKGRAFLAGLEQNDNTILLSKYLVPGLACEFCEDSAFSVIVNPVGGKITELAVLDDTLVIFKERAIFALTGEGPTNAGQSSDYFNPRALSQSIGAARANVTCEIPPGLLFVSHKGIYLLGRDLSLTYMEQVKAYEALTFLSVDRIPDTTQVRLTTLEGTTLVYDYHFTNWSTYAGLPGVDAIIFNDKHAVLSSSGVVSVQKSEADALPYQDDDGYVAMSLVSSWYFPNGPQGYCQLDRLIIDGSYLSAHNLYISIAFDQKPANVRTFVVATASLSSLYSFSLPVYQTCTSFQVSIHDDGAGASATLAIFRAETTLIDGGNRLAPKRR